MEIKFEYYQIIIIIINIIIIIIIVIDRLVGLVVSMSDYWSWGRGSIPGTSTILNVDWVWNGVHPASWGQLGSYLIEK